MQRLFPLLLSLPLLVAAPAFAADVPPAIDGTPNPAFVPVHQRSYTDPAVGSVQQIGEIAILEGDAAIVSDDGMGSLGISMVAGEPGASAIATRFYTQYDDLYEELVIFTTFDDTGSAGALAYLQPVKQDTLGLGQPLFDGTGSYGATKGFLKGFVNMKHWSQYQQIDGLPITDPRSNFYPTMGQEFAHRWLAFMKYRDRGGKDSFGLLGRDQAHWASTLQADGSVMDGNLLADNQDGSYTVVESFKRYGYLDLYGMGLVPDRDVPPFFRIPNAVDKSGARINPAVLLRAGSRLFGAREDIGISQVVAANGPRVPAWDKAPHSFRIAFVLVTAPGEKAADVADVAQALEQVRKVWEAKFHAYTGGRGSVCTQLSAPCGAATAKVVASRFAEAGGNGNGVVEPGEPLTLTITLYNDGQTRAEGVSITPASDGLPIAQVPGTLDEIVPGASRSIDFAATLPAAAPCGVPIVVSTTASIDGNNFRGFASLIPGVTDAWSAVFDRSAQLFVADAGSASTDTATANRWEYGQPLSYAGLSGFVFQPSSGHAGGRRSWFTGLGRGHRLQQDSSLGVGASRLYSPPIPLGNLYLPSLRYWVWYQSIDFSNPRGSGQTRDDLPLLVDASSDGGATWITLDSITGAEAAWRERSIPLDGKIALGGSLLLRFTAANDAPTTLVEAGLDEIRLITQTPACNPNQPPITVSPMAHLLAGGGCTTGPVVFGDGPGFSTLLIAALGVLGLVALRLRRA